MNLTAEQSRAVDKFREWVKNPAGPFRLFGPAGSGKTTLARYLMEGAGRVEVATYTGKAASVLKRKGVPARTIHSLIYRLVGNDNTLLAELQEALDVEEDPFERERLERELRKAKEDAGPKFTLNFDSDLKDTDLLILDECSMIPESMARDLLSFRCPILVLGDPYQLPPVKGQGYFTREKPDVLLEEIHRQAQESGIIRLASKIRDGYRPDPYENFGSDVHVLNIHDFVKNYRSEIRPPEQVIVGRHKTRRRAIVQLRLSMGAKSIFPEPGDRVICKRNNHQKGLLNGEQFTVLRCANSEKDFLWLELVDDSDEIQHCRTFKEPFLGQDVPWQYADEAEHFDYGNAITCHAAQGSEWDKVIVIDEGRFFKPHTRKWRYTAATRASEELIYVV